MAQNLLDRLDESIGMEEYDINKGIANAAMQRGISPVEMRAQVLKQMMEADGRTISDDDLRLFALGEITLSDVMGRTLSDQDLGGRTISDSDYITFPGGRQIRTQEKLTRDIIDSIKGKMGKKFQQWGRTLSDLDQVTEVDALQELAADSGRTLSDQDLAIGRTMSDQDFATQKRSQDFQQYLQGILNESGANISDRDRQIIQDFMGSNVDPNTLSDRDRQIIEELFKRKRSQGRTPSESNSDAAILEMLK